MLKGWGIVPFLSASLTSDFLSSPKGTHEEGGGIGRTRPSEG